MANTCYESSLDVTSCKSSVPRLDVICNLGRVKKGTQSHQNIITKKSFVQNDFQKYVFFYKWEMAKLSFQNIAVPEHKHIIIRLTFSMLLF